MSDQTIIPKIEATSIQTAIPSLSSQQTNTALWLYAYASFFLILTYSCYKLKQARKRKRKNEKIRFIEKDKIILAIEIKDFVVKYSEKPGYGYLPLNIIAQQTLWQSLYKKIFSVGHFYRAIFPIPKIKEFMFGLASINKVSLILYTSLQPAVAQVVLYKLGLDKCFPVDMRKYCDLQNHDDLKHAIQVDKQSRRVIILTPTYEDHRHEDQKYFLVLRPKPEQPNFLKNWLKDLKSFLEQNININNLHEQLTQFKLNYDSETSQNQN